ncbi:MAG: hypothetical protein CM1200mP20_03770 [Pseudomonadota bacterium]|nr:MAG: hypothetical protein CM1200mP20_03770 [Pseudomonadota bacterium]
MTQESDQWPLWEVFVRGRRGLTHQHAGAFMPPMPDGTGKRA